MVLADPGLVKAELVEMDDQVEIALEALGRVLLVRVEGRQEDAVPKGDLAHRGLACIWRHSGPERSEGTRNPRSQAGVHGFRARRFAAPRIDGFRMSA